MYRLVSVRCKPAPRGTKPRRSLSARPADAACGTCLASALQELAAQLSETGRLAEAEPLLREALALYEKHLTRSRDVGDRVKLARSHWSLVGLLYRSRQYPEAEEHARRALDLMKRAVADAPLVPSYRALLAAHWDGLALMLRQRGQAKEADEASRLALVELEEQADLRLVTNIVNCDPAEVGIGMPVQVDFEEQADVFVPVFKPINETS